MDDSGREDNARIEIATEDSDNTEMAPGDVPMTTASGIIDAAAVSEPAQLRAISTPPSSISRSPRILIELEWEEQMDKIMTGIYPYLE